MNILAELKLFKDYKKEIKSGLLNLKVIYTDLDGTLLNDKGCLLKDEGDCYFLEVAKCIRKIGEQNIDLVLASGRKKDQLRYNAQVLGLKNYIAELGCELVYDQGKEVRVTFDSEKVDYDTGYGGKDLIKIINILKKAFPRKIEGRLEWNKYRSFNALFFGNIDLEKANKLLKKKGYNGLCLVENGKTSLVDDLDLDVDSLYIYNLMPEGVDKASAIALDKKIRGISREQCIALGDSPADISMAAEVKYFFLMGGNLKDDNFRQMVAGYDNIYITSQKMNRGWVEVIGYLVG